MTILLNVSLITFLSLVIERVTYKIRTFAPDMKRIIFFLTIIMTVTTTSWGQQRIVNNRTNSMGIGDDLGNNMTEEDRNRANQRENNKEVTDVPVDLKQWTLSRQFGDVRPIPVDTLWDYYQNVHLTEGLNGEYNHLGNLGSPRQSRIFFNREERSQQFFTDVYSFFYQQPDQFHFTDTKSPYTNLSYYSAGNKLNGDDHFKAYFAVNANKRFGLGFLADYLYGRGQYHSQSTAYFNASLYSYYRGERYQAYFLGSRIHMKQAENGGITDDRYITDPLEMAEGERTYSPENIPTLLDKTWNRNENWNFYLTHRYNLGFYRDADIDTTLAATDTTSMEDRIFVPVTSFIHTAEVNTNDHGFIGRNEPNGYYLHDYMPNDDEDNTTYLSVKNTLAIATQEGFSKWAQAGLTAFIAHEYRRFGLPDTIAGTNREYNHLYAENMVSVGGRLLRTQGKTLHYDVTGETVIAGEDLGQFSLEGKGDLNLRLFKDTVRLDIHAYMKNLNPAFYFRHYHSRHYWWDNKDLDKIFRTRIEGKLTINKTHTRLRAGVENIKNYTYFANVSQPITNASGQIKSYANALDVAQCSDNIQVFTAQLNQNFKLGIFHLDNEVTFQKSSNNTVLPLPDWSLYHNLYMQFKIAKVLSMQIGADVRFFTKYTAPDYSPALGQFVQQNQADKVEIGGYPFVNAYINAHLKRTRFYVMMYHVNQGTGDANYFLAPHYPVNPRTLQLGLSWNFFD